MKKFFKDFKEFISRGNILDMAIGVIIGTAFSAIITALTDKIIMPVINLILSGGGNQNGLSSAYTFLKKVTLEDGTVDLANSIYIDWGAFITAVLNFLIIAFTLFVILRVAMKSSKMIENAKKKIDSEYKLTKADKKELKNRGIKLYDVKAVNAYRKERVAEIKAAEEAKLAEEKAKLEAEKLAHPTQEDLLVEIRDLLKTNKKETKSQK